MGETGNSHGLSRLSGEETDAHAAPPPRPGAVRRIAGVLLVLLAGAGAVGATAGIQRWLEHRAAAAPVEAAEPAPLSVATRVLADPAPFAIEEGYVGRIEPARSADLAFERGGLLEAVLVEEGARVAAGDVLARLDVAELNARRRELAARRAANEAQRELALLSLERTRSLRERGHATEQELDAARLAHARLSAATEEIEAGIEQVEILLDKSVLAAPFDGRIAARRADEGAILAAGTPVVDILETGRPRLRVGLPEARLAALRPGDAVPVEWRGARHEGTVAAVRPDMDEETQTGILLVDLPADVPFAFGGVARVVLERELGGTGWTLPIAALKESARGLWSVLVVRPPAAPGAPSTAGLETVEVLAAADGVAFVRGTLEAGMEVIVEGRHRVTRGDPVAPVPAADETLQRLADGA